MSVKDQLIEALKALCEREGGAWAVADRIGSSEATLTQIIRGVKLPSGAPRGVGPKLQRLLESHYPGWSGLQQHEAGNAAGQIEELDDSDLSVRDVARFMSTEDMRRFLDDVRAAVTRGRARQERPDEFMHMLNAADQIERTLTRGDKEH